LDISDVQRRLQKFADERDWNQFHNPKNLVMALSGEMGELAEIFQWLTDSQSIELKKESSEKDAVEEEIADMLLYLLRLSDKLDIDLNKAIDRKLKKNADKYPVSLAKGNATKYNRRG
jgi:NTP pyrophosphatase (non-canonical NTP hydrolase)